MIACLDIQVLNENGWRNYLKWAVQQGVEAGGPLPLEYKPGAVLARCDDLWKSGRYLARAFSWWLPKDRGDPVWSAGDLTRLIMSAQAQTVIDRYGPDSMINTLARYQADEIEATPPPAGDDYRAAWSVLETYLDNVCDYTGKRPWIGCARNAIWYLQYAIERAALYVDPLAERQGEKESDASVTT